MPRSRGRKKNKKDTSKKKMRNKREIETFKFDGGKIVRDGSNLLLQNTRTPEQHASFMEMIKANRPKQLETIEKSVDRVVAIFNTYDSLSLLGGLAAVQIIETQAGQEKDGIAEVTMESALSFATALKNDKKPVPSSKILNELKAVLVNLRHTYNAYIMTETAVSKFSPIEDMLRLKTISNALFVRGDGYLNHVYTIYKELFLAHDVFLQSHYGFTSEQILNTFIQLEESFLCRLVMPNEIPHPASHSRFVGWANSKDVEKITNSGKHFIDAFGDDNPDLIVNNSKIGGFRLDNISSYPELYEVRFRYAYQRLVVAATAQEFGDNSDFLNPKFKGLPLNDTTVTTRPIIKQDEKYYHFAFSLPSRNFIEMTEQLIANADAQYYNNKYLGNKYHGSRDNYLERKSFELFRKIIPNSTAFPNCKYLASAENGERYETELDLLIVSQTAIYLIEMKAGGLSAPAKRGALKSLSGQLKDSVGYGAYQSFRAYKHVIENKHPEFVDEQGNVVKIDSRLKKFRITITLKHLASLIAYMYDLKELKIIDNSVGFAWTCSIYDLMVFASILESEADFIDYLEKRIPLYERPELHFNDEIDLLGHFLEHNLEFDEELIKDLTSFQITGFSKDIDEYFERGGKKPTRKQRI